MAQPPLPNQNFYHSHPHLQQRIHGQLQPPSHPQLQLPTQFRSPFNVRIFDDRAGAINYNYIRPYMQYEPQHPTDDGSDSFVMRRPRRTRTTFTNKQIAELEQHFLQARYLTSSRVSELAAKLALGTAQVKIWFKNRRRRHKLQADHQHRPDLSTSFTYDGMPVSPTMPSNTSDSYDGGMMDVVNTLQAPPSVGSSCSSSESSTPPNLTPSPTPPANTGRNVPNGVELFQSYYYCNHPGTHTGLLTPQPEHPYQTLPSVAPDSTVAQYFAPPPAVLSQPLQHQPRSHARLPYSHFEHRLRCGSVDRDGIGTGVGDNIPRQDNAAYNYSNPNSAGIPSTAAAITDVSSTMTSVDGSPPNTQPTAMSPMLDEFELLTSKYEESPSRSNNRSGNVIASNQLDHPNINIKTLQILGPSSNIADGNDNSADALLIMEECTGAFSKYSKLCSGEAHETSYVQCTMDTIMHAYSNHRHTASNTQFAYCYN